MDLATYRSWVSDTGIVRSRLASVVEPIWPGANREDHQGERQARHGRRVDDGGYTPARPPVTQSPQKWPPFPGEGMTYTGGPPAGSDPGDEDHMGGPR